MNDSTYSSEASSVAPAVTTGSTVYDANGDKLGVVAELDPENDGFIVQKGHFFLRDIPVPMSAVSLTDADGVYLNVSKDDASDGKWNDSAVTTTPSDVDAETPYHADPAQSVGDRDLNVSASDVITDAYATDPSADALETPGIEQEGLER